MTARIYCGTYGKYASGSIDGEWFDVEDYADKDEFLEACQEYHDRNNPTDEDGDPIPAEHEFMFQCSEGVPAQFLSESHVDEELWNYLDYDDHHHGAAKEAYMACFDTWSERDFEERFRGEYDSWTALAEEFLDETGTLEQIPESLRYYFDYEAYGRDLRLSGDMCEESGYYFWNH